MTLKQKPRIITTTLTDTILYQLAYIKESEGYSSRASTISAVTAEKYNQIYQRNQDNGRLVVVST